MPEFAVRPVTPENWTDFAALFEARGGPHYCWCTIHRFSAHHLMSSPEKKSAMHDLVAGGTPIGVLAYDKEVPAGWCSIAPRESYAGLLRSRKMPRVTPLAVPTWTVLCFFVARPYRGQSLTETLLRGAVAYARSQGAQEIEAYPFDTAGNSSTHRGHSSAFEKVGFHRDGVRWHLYSAES
jgi:hypothetical protein